jgi:hypothetical protein
VPRKDRVSKKSKKIKRLEKALKSAKRDSYGPAMITKSGRPRCPNPGCRRAAKYSGQNFCTRCGGGMLAGLAKGAGANTALMTRLAAVHDPMERERLYYSEHPELRAPWAPRAGGAA